MVTSPDRIVNPLPAVEDQTQKFWRFLDGCIQPEDWTEAIRAAMGCLDGLPVFEYRPEPSRMMADILDEGQFGSNHWRLSRFKQVYYQFVRPLLPGFLRTPLRTILLSTQRNGSVLNWPIEDRYVRFQFDSARRLLENKQLDSLPFVHFWPEGKRFAFVVTHDVEADNGQQHVREVAALDERYGFRSSFNFVPEKYRVDADLMGELKERGFEVGVHGLKHDGRLFSSKAVFEKRARQINRYLKQWEAVGFRSPMTHRNPEWMQALDIEYDSSFFDTDPYEPIPGGVMSIWPFQMGRFIELPYTLVQDHTLMITLGEKSPRLWLEKVEFIKKYCGMALVNVHPDYLRNPAYFAIYKDFLGQMSQIEDSWQALPCDVAHWWKQRAQLNLDNNSEDPQVGLPGATTGVIRLEADGIKIVL